MQNLQLTELESLVLKSLSNQDEYDELPTSTIGNLIEETGISSKSIRGVLSSLVQKGLVKTTTFINGKIAFQFLYN